MQALVAGLVQGQGVGEVEGASAAHRDDGSLEEADVGDGGVRQRAHLIDMLVQVPADRSGQGWGVGWGGWGPEGACVLGSGWVGVGGKGVLG